jgi:hypothetical protein
LYTLCLQILYIWYQFLFSYILSTRRFKLFRICIESKPSTLNFSKTVLIQLKDVKAISIQSKAEKFDPEDLRNKTIDFLDLTGDFITSQNIISFSLNALSLVAGINKFTLSEIEDLIRFLSPELVPIIYSGAATYFAVDLYQDYG